MSRNEAGRLTAGPFLEADSRGQGRFLVSGKRRLLQEVADWEGPSGAAPASAAQAQPAPSCSVPRTLAGHPQ